MIADPHCPNAIGVGWAEGPVAVANQMTWRFVPGESVSHLPSDPLGSRIGSDANLHAARTWRHRLQSEAEQTSAISALVDRVELKSDGIRVSIKLPIAGAEKSRAPPTDQVAIARSFPIQLKRLGVELRLIVGDHNRSTARVDLSLFKAVARAHRW